MQREASPCSVAEQCVGLEGVSIEVQKDAHTLGPEETP
jgi:hypothetical protein